MKEISRALAPLCWHACALTAVFEQPEIRLLQSSGDRAARSAADSPPVKASDRNNAAGGAGQERLVGGVDVEGLYPSDDDLDSASFCELDNGPPRNPAKDVVCRRRQDAVLDDEDVITRRLADIPFK